MSSKPTIQNVLLHGIVCVCVCVCMWVRARAYKSLCVCIHVVHIEFWQYVFVKNVCVLGALSIHYYFQTCMHPVLQVIAVQCIDSTVIKFHQKNNIRSIEMERNDTHTKKEKKNKIKSLNSQWNCHIPDQRSQTSTVAAVCRRHLQDGVQRLFSCISRQLLD